MSKKTKSLFIEIFLWISIGIYLFPGLVGRITYIPSPSMTPTLMEGDKVWLSKLHYGARTPGTLLQIPIFFEKKYFKKPRIPMSRLPGFGSLQLGYCVVFNFPANLEDNLDMSPWYVKRCVGTPGSTFRMEESIVYVDGAALVLPEGVELQHRYLVTLQGFRHKSKEEQYLQAMLGASNVRGYYQDHTHVVYTTAKEAERLKGCKEVKALKQHFFEPKADAKVTYFSYEQHHDTGIKFSECLGGTEDYLPEIVVPARGMTIDVTYRNLCIYGHVILHHEGHKDVQIDAEQGTLTIDGKQVERYTFVQDYYFVKGDNRPDSYDSSSWGFMSAECVVGKPILIFFSNKNNNTLLDLLTLQLRWRRTFRWVR